MISIKTQNEIAIMHQAGKALAAIMKKIKAEAKPSVATKDLNKLAEELIFKSGLRPAFKGYQGYPAALCASVNNEVVHAVPSKRKLQEGDIIGLDLGIFYPIDNLGTGFYSDMAITVGVGNIDPEAGRLVRVAKKALKRAITRVKPGKTLGDIGQAVQSYVESQGFSVVKELCGHGIGKQLHEAPEIPNFGQRHKGQELKEGMVLALEPMINAGDYKIKKSADGYGFETADGSLSAHFEHTVAVTEKGCTVLTEM